MNPIHINPKHKGEFTAWAKAHGFASVQAAASAVLANKDKYPPHVVQMANFAHNSQSFNHTPSLGKLLGK